MLAAVVRAVDIHRDIRIIDRAIFRNVVDLTAVVVVIHISPHVCLIMTQIERLLVCIIVGETIP